MFAPQQRIYPDAQPASNVPEQTGIHRETKEIEEGVSLIASQINLLTSKLASVLRPAPPDDTQPARGSVEEAPLRAPHSNRLHDIAFRIASTNHLLADIIERLDC